MYFKVIIVERGTYWGVHCFMLDWWIWWSSYKLQSPVFTASKFLIPSRLTNCFFPSQWEIFSPSQKIILDNFTLLGTENFFPSFLLPVKCHDQSIRLNKHKNMAVKINKGRPITFSLPLKLWALFCLLSKWKKQRTVGSGNYTHTHTQMNSLVDDQWEKLLT